MDTSISIRTDKEVRNKAQRVFASLGISTSAGVNLFLRQVIAEKGLPFKPTRNADEIRKKWDAEVAEAVRDYKSGKRKGFATAEELHDHLDRT